MRTNRSVSEEREHVGQEVREVWKHLAHEIRNARKHVGNEPCGAWKQVVYKARWTLEYVAIIIQQSLLNLLPPVFSLPYMVIANLINVARGVNFQHLKLEIMEPSP